MLLGIKTFNDKFHLGFDLSEIQETGIEVWRAILDYIRDTQKITHQNLSSGGRSFTSVADPAIFTYSISNKRDMGLEVSVFNAGIQPVTSGKLVCYAGAVNDPVLFRSNGETKTIIGEQPLPKIEPFEEVVVSIPWQITQAGTWPVFCNIDSKEDGYLGNSSARKVLELFSN
ncbi:MAG: hypothetical protein HY072_08445 [Deltaproteobacteria bacterium]|nr:hypothetical protein [Deltaproteobacteria bacterium]